MNSMEMGLFEMLWQTATASTTVIMVIGIIAAMLIVSVWVTKIGDKILPKPKETRVADFLPFSRLDEDGATIHLRNNAMCRVLEVEGADTTLVLPEERAAFASAHKWLCGGENGAIIMYTFLKGLTSEVKSVILGT